MEVIYTAYTDGVWAEKQNTNGESILTSCRRGKIHFSTVFTVVATTSEKGESHWSCNCKWWAFVEPGLPLPVPICCMSTVRSLQHFALRESHLCPQLSVGVLRASWERGYVSIQAGISIPEAYRCTELTPPHVLVVSWVFQVYLQQILASWCLKARLFCRSTWTVSCFKVP